MTFFFFLTYNLDLEDNNMKEHLAKTFSSYLMVGLANTATSISVMLVMYFFGYSDEEANFFGILAGVIQSILLNSKFTFRQDSINLGKSLIFFLILVFSYLVNLGVLFIALNLIGLSSFTSQLLAMSSHTLVSFFMLRKIFV